MLAGYWVSGNMLKYWSSHVCIDINETIKKALSSDPYFILNLALYDMNSGQSWVE